MKYILQMIVDESAWQNLTPEEMKPMIDEMERFNDQLREGGAWVSGEGLDFSSNAKTVRVVDGKRTVTDGPYGTAREQLGGFWIIEAATIDDAVGWAEHVPMTNGSIEVRVLVPEEQDLSRGGPEGRGAAVPVLAVRRGELGPQPAGGTDGNDFTTEDDGRRSRQSSSPRRRPPRFSKRG